MINLLVLLSMFFTKTNSEQNIEIINLSPDQLTDFVILNDSDAYIEYFIINSDTLYRKHSFNSALKFNYSKEIKSLKILIVSSSDSEIKVKAINRSQNREIINVKNKRIINMIQSI